MFAFSAHSGEKLYNPSWAWTRDLLHKFSVLTSLPTEPPNYKKSFGEVSNVTNYWRPGNSDTGRYRTLGEKLYSPSRARTQDLLNHISQLYELRHKFIEFRLEWKSLGDISIVTNYCRPEFEPGSLWYSRGKIILPIQGYTHDLQHYFSQLYLQRNQCTIFCNSFLFYIFLLLVNLKGHILTHNKCRIEKIIFWRHYQLLLAWILTMAAVAKYPFVP